VHYPRLEENSEKLTVLGTIIGSPSFMSPEQAAGKENIDARSDIYSLGGVAYFLLTGQYPFVRENALQTLMAHAYDPVIRPGELRPDIPANLESIILKCLEKQPDRRYQNINCLEKALGLCPGADLWTEDRA